MKKINQKDIKLGWAYVRVSSVEQGNVLHGSLEQQQNSIERWAKEQTHRTGVQHKIVRYLEEDISGRKQSLHKRKDYHELVRAIKTGNIDFVVIEKVDRLNRNFVENRRFVEICQEKGVDFYLRDGGLVDFKDRGSRLGYNIQSMIAEEYSLDLEEKVTKKQREARVNNGKDTNTVPLLGLDNHPTKYGFYVINENEQKMVREIFLKFVECGDLVETVKFCHLRDYRTKTRLTREKSGEGGIIIQPRKVGGDEFTPKTLRRLLVSRKIVGFGYFEDTWNQFPLLQDTNKMVRWQYAHPPVVEIELFERAQRILAENKKHDHRHYANGRVYCLSGILADQDGNSFHGHTVAGQHPYYECQKSKLRIPAKQIEKAVIDEVKRLYTESGVWERVLNDTLKNSQRADSVDDEISSLQKELASIDNMMTQHEQAYQEALKQTDMSMAGRLMVEKVKREDEWKAKRD